MFPIEAARWALSLEVLRTRRTGEKFTNKDLKRVCKDVRTMSSCTPAMARKMVAYVATKETFNDAIKAPFIVPSITPEDVKAARVRTRVVTSKKKRRSKSKKKSSKKKVLKR